MSSRPDQDLWARVKTRQGALEARGNSGGAPGYWDRRRPRYLFTGLIFCVFPPKAMAAICAALLLGYWALATFVPVRDFNLEKKHLASLQLTPEAPETAQTLLESQA